MLLNISGIDPRRREVGMLSVNGPACNLVKSGCIGSSL
jgi:hypothetical protein